MATQPWLIFPLLAQRGYGAFNVFEGYDTMTQYAPGISSGCLQAL
jgi:hypothetical protein